MLSLEKLLSSIAEVRLQWRHILDLPDSETLSCPVMNI